MSIERVELLELYRVIQELHERVQKLECMQEKKTLISPLEEWKKKHGLEVKK